jgi:hypothetical protein
MKDAEKESMNTTAMHRHMLNQHNIGRPDHIMVLFAGGGDIPRTIVIVFVESCCFVSPCCHYIGSRLSVENTEPTFSAKNQPTLLSCAAMVMVERSSSLARSWVKKSDGCQVRTELVFI